MIGAVRLVGFCFVSASCHNVGVQVYNCSFFVTKSYFSGQLGSFFFVPEVLVSLLARSIGVQLLDLGTVGHFHIEFIQNRDPTSIPPSILD